MAIQAARAAGQIILEAYKGTDKHVQHKANASDLVTQTDVQCEDLLKRKLFAEFPQHHFIGKWNKLD